jgi:hypothetical protein
MKDWAVTIGIALLMGLAVWFWRGSVDKAACDKRVAAVIDSLKSSWASTRLRDSTIWAQGHRVTDRHDTNVAPNPSAIATLDTGAVPVVAVAPVVLSSDTLPGVRVGFTLTTTYYPRTMQFQHDFYNIKVDAQRDVFYIDRVEYRDKETWETVAELLLAGGATYFAVKEKPVPAAVCGGLLVFKLAINF